MDKVNFLSVLVVLFATHLSTQDEVLNNDLGRRSSEGGASTQLSEELLEQEEELELLAQSVVKEALKKVDRLKNEADKQEMMELVTKFREIIFALIENHFQDEPLTSDHSMEEEISQNDPSNSFGKSKIDEEKYNKIIDEVIDEVVEMRKQENAKKDASKQNLVKKKPDHKHKKMNAFMASRNTENGLKPAQPQKNSKHEKVSDFSDELVSELKRIKTVQKKYNLAESQPTPDNKQKSWVKYLIYDKNEDKPSNPKVVSDESAGSEEQQLKGLKASPKKGMLESTQIKGGQVDFTSGKKTQPPPLVHPTLKQQDMTQTETKKSPDNADVYSLINQMIALLKHADGKEE